MCNCALLLQPLSGKTILGNLLSASAIYIQSICISHQRSTYFKTFPTVYISCAFIRSTSWRQQDQDAFHRGADCRILPAHQSNWHTFAGVQVGTDYGPLGSERRNNTRGKQVHSKQIPQICTKYVPSNSIQIKTVCCKDDGCERENKPKTRLL